MKCDVCTIDVIIFERQSDTGMTERYSECPKCHNQISLGFFETLDMIEQEYEFNLVIRLPGILSMAQLKIIREYSDEFKDVGIVKAKTFLKERNELMLGPFWPKFKADEVKAKIEATGMKVKYKL